MPHMDLPSCLSTDGTLEGREKRQGDRKPCPGPNGALSPASPPGFVTALSTARSRDAPAECFDERLPRRLPYEGVLALLYSLFCPASSHDPVELTGPRLCEWFYQGHLPFLFGRRFRSKCPGRYDRRACRLLPGEE